MILQKRNKKIKGTFRDVFSILQFVKEISMKYFVIAGFYTIIDTLAPFINFFL